MKLPFILSALLLGGSLPVFAETKAETETKKTPDVTISEGQLTVAKLKETIIPEVNFKDTSIYGALAFLEKSLQESDLYKGKGKKIVFKIICYIEEDEKVTDLKLKDASLKEVFEYVLKTSRMNYVIKDNTIEIISNDKSRKIFTRNFRVDSDLYKSLKMCVGEEAYKEIANPEPTIQELLEKVGIKFPKGTSAVYNSKIKVLTVKNRKEAMDMLDELLYSSR